MIPSDIRNLITPIMRKRFLYWVQLSMVILSVVVIGAVIVDYGFVQDETEEWFLLTIYSTMRWAYIGAFIINLAFQWGSITRKTIWLTLFNGVLLTLMTIPDSVPTSVDTSTLYLTLKSMLENRYFLPVVLFFFAVIEVSKGVVQLLNKRTTPALLLTVTFALVIALGMILLLLPRSTHEDVRLSAIDALFISTSAVCVTGLSPLDVAETFTGGGLVIIAVLIQIGGLGIMTITSFFTLFYMGHTGLYNQFALRDMFDSDSFSSLLVMLLYILGFTFVIELLGAVAIWLSIHGTLGMTLQDELFFSVFHSVSAFCNAGFSTMSGNLGNPMLMGEHNVLYIVVSTLIVLGGLGFPILINLKSVLFYWVKDMLRTRKWKGLPHNKHLANVNTKIVLTVTGHLVLIGTIFFLILEWNGAFAEMTIVEKIVHALFNSVSSRTAGFNSVDLSSFSTLAVLIYIVLMWIGGGSQSTAGGIKVNTIAVMYANFMSVVKRRDSINLYKREVSEVSVRRASAVMFGSVIVIVVSFALLIVMEPGMSCKALLFEVVSAVSTVGSSLGVTGALGGDSKFLLVLLMFVGRVGFISVLMSIAMHTKELRYRYPKDNVIIN